MLCALLSLSLCLSPSEIGEREVQVVLCELCESYLANIFGALR